MQESIVSLLTLRSLRKRFDQEKTVSVNDKAMFLLRTSELLQEGYTIHECFTLLLPHHCTNNLQLIRKVEETFRDGQGVSRVLQTLGFPNRILLSVKLSENDGRLAESLRGASIRLEAAQLRRQKFIQAATYPIVLMIAMAMLLIAFKLYFLPNFETLAASRSATTSGVEKYLPRIVAKAPDLFLYLMAVGAACTIAGSLYLKRLSPAEKIRKVSSFPLLGQWYTLILTRLFSSETGNLLAAGNSIQEAMVILKNQTIDPVLAEIARSIHKEAAKGEPFHTAIELTDGMTKDLSFFAKHGADSGYLAKEILLYSEQLGNTIDRNVNRTVAMLQPILFVILAVCIISAYLALLLPVYGMIKNM